MLIDESRILIVVRDILLPQINSDFPVLSLDVVLNVPHHPIPIVAIFGKVPAVELCVLR